MGGSKTATVEAKAGPDIAGASRVVQTCLSEAVDALLAAVDALLAADDTADSLAALSRSRQFAEGALALADDTMRAMAGRLIEAGIPADEVVAFSRICSQQGGALLCQHLADACFDHEAEDRFDAAFGEIAGHA